MARSTTIASRGAAALASLLVFGALSGCGGGVDVAPSTPSIDGSGMAVANFAGADQGQTRQVSAIVSASRQQVVGVVGETVTLDAAGFGRVANIPMSSTVAVGLNGPGGPYTQGADGATCAADPACQFWVEDSAAGVLGRSAAASSPIPTGVPLTVSYSYFSTFLDVTVSVNYGALGEDITVSAFNIGSTESGPYSTIVQAAAAPADGSKAFDARVRAQLLQPTGQQDFEVVPSAIDRLDVTSVNLTNQLNPCISGHLVTAMTDRLNPDPLNPVTLDVTFDDSNC
jgi:hypothetical protein